MCLPIRRFFFYEITTSPPFWKGVYKSAENCDFSSVLWYHRGKQNAQRKKGGSWKNRASPKPANSTPIVEPFINTSPSLTFPLTRLRKHTTVEQADGRQNSSLARERERLDSARVIRPVFADRYRCPIDGMEVFPGRDSGGGVHSRLSRRNDLVRGLNSRSHSLLNGTTWSRESARARVGETL